MPDLPERTPYFRASDNFAAYFKNVHAGGALDAKTKELIHLALVLHSSLPFPRAWLWVIAERSEYSSVDPQRLERDVGIVERKHIRRCQLAGVLGNDGICRLLRSRVQVRLEDGPAVPGWSVFLEERR